jgi:hypothetical protein
MTAAPTLHVGATEHPLHTISTLWTLLVAPSLDQLCSLLIDAMELERFTDLICMGWLTTVGADIGFAFGATHCWCFWSANTRVHALFTIAIRLCSRKHVVGDEGRATCNRAVERVRSTPFLVLGLEQLHLVIVQVRSNMMQRDLVAAARRHA